MIRCDILDLFLVFTKPIPRTHFQNQKTIPKMIRAKVSTVRFPKRFEITFSVSKKWFPKWFHSNPIGIAMILFYY
jgi:hypothetical protein